MRDGQIKELLSYKFSAAMKEYRERDKDFYINLGFCGKSKFTLSY